jgi:deoxyribonucleoside regulator
MTVAQADQIQMLMDVARRYYIDGANQGEIADEIHASRPTVSRLLSQARELGVVKIKIEHPYQRTDELEQRLVSRFGLKHAWVCRSGPHEDVVTAVAKHAASIVGLVVERDSVVGMSNGTTLAAMVAAIRGTRRVGSCVVQMIGSLGQETLLIDSPDLCRRLAEQFGGGCRVMPVPLIVRTSRLATAMRRETSVATTLALGSQPDVAFVGIGACDTSGSGHIFDGWMTPAINAELVASGAVGHVLGHHYDRSGRHIESQLCARTVGVPLAQLRSIPFTIGVAGGASKVPAIAGALAGGYLTGLVTDATTAQAVLAS